MGTSGRSARTERVGPSGRGVEGLVAVAAVLVILVLLKPWGTGGSGVPPSPIADRAAIESAQPAVVAKRSAAPVATPLPADAIECHGALELVSLTRLADWSVREWLPVVPVRASGPVDPSLADVLLSDGAIRALGVCATSSSGAPLGLALRAAWRVTNGGPVPLTLTRLSDSLPAADLAPLYRPVDAVRGDWPDGRYVLELASPNAGPAWLAVAIGATVRRSPGP